MNNPGDVRNLIKAWLRDVAETGELPFKGNTGGVVVQMLNVWLKSYEMDKMAEIEVRLKALEEAQTK